MRGTRAKALRRSLGVPHPGRRHGGVVGLRPSPSTAGPKVDLITRPERREQLSLWRRLARQARRYATLYR